jgi:predicted Kef-type K+ transport protein
MKYQITILIATLIVIIGTISTVFVSRVYNFNHNEDTALVISLCFLYLGVGGWVAVVFKDYIKKNGK